MERGATFADDAGIAGWTATGLETRVRQFRRLWRVWRLPAGWWLDIGCGAGTYSRLLRDDGNRVIGVDYALTSLQRAASRRDNADVAWLAADVNALPVAAESADGILCLGVMQALGSPTRALGEFARVLRPGGHLVVDALNAHCLPTRFGEWRRARRGGARHLRYDVAATLSDALVSEGFELRGVHWLTILPGRLSRLQFAVEAGVVRWCLHAAAPLGAALSHSFILHAVRRQSD